MKITALRAYALEVPATLDITEPPRQLSHQICVVEIDTDAGITGHGLTTIGLARAYFDHGAIRSGPAIDRSKPPCSREVI